MIAVSFLFGLVMIAGIMLPFFIKGNTRLAAASSVQSIPRLKAEKAALVKRYVEEEELLVQKHITKMAWQQRQQFLMNRYTDAARRLDFLESAAKEEGELK